jgi:four helix bundle protein
MLMSIRERAYSFGLKIIIYCRKMPTDKVSGAICSQLVRSGTSIGANLEEAKDAMSRADFIKSTIIALKEARETFYWLRIIRDVESTTQNDLAGLIQESEELVKILVKTVKTTKEKIRNS